MAKFKDSDDREWTLFIDIPAVKELRKHDLDVLGMFDGGFEVFEKLVGDPVRLVDTLWVLCTEQVSNRGMDETAFAKALYGDALLRATNALIEAVCDFFPDPKRRATIMMVFRKIQEAEGILLDNAQTQVEGLNVSEIAKEMEKEYTEKSGDSEGSSA